MKYQPALDGLRALSVLTVIVYHLPGNPIPGGWIGVDIFFVLSGFLITKILSTELQATGRINLKNFYMARFFRLAPALFVLLGAVALVSPLFPARQKELLQGTAMALTYLANWNLIYEWWPAGVVGHTWTLSVEEQFYFIWPFLLLLIPRHRIVAALVFLILLSTDWRFSLTYQSAPVARTIFGSDTYASSLLLGCLIAVKSGPRLVQFCSRTWWVAAFGIAAILLTQHSYMRFTRSFGILFASIFAAWLILALQENKTLIKWLSAKPLVYTGKLSYSLYLWHHAILLLIYWYFWPTSEKLPPPESNLARLAVWVSVIVASFIFASLSYRFVEKPALRLKGKFLGHRPPTTNAGAA